MYLVHIYLQPPVGGDLLPSDMAASVVASAGDIIGFEHVAVHSGNCLYPVIGVFINAATLEVAEATAESIWWRAWNRLQWLRRWTLLRVEVPLLLPEEGGPSRPWTV